MLFQLGIAQTYAGISVNDLTDEQFVDELCGNAAVNGVPVEVFGKGAFCCKSCIKFPL